MINEILEQIKKQIKVFENKTAEEEKIYKLYLNARKSIVNKEINYQLLFFKMKMKMNLKELLVK